MNFFLDNVLEPNLPAILDSLTHVGATSVPILRPDWREPLVHTARSLPYQRQAEEVGKGERLVRQQVASCDEFSQATIFLRLRDAFQDLLAQSLANLRFYPFSFPIDLNTMVLQQYEPGSLGITPHRDGKRYQNLICIFVLEGQGKFRVCRNRAGNSPIEIDASPGNVVLMRAPGFRGINDRLATTDEIRPFHFVTDIQTQRYTFTLRQKAS